MWRVGVVAMHLTLACGCAPTPAAAPGIDMAMSMGCVDPPDQQPPGSVCVTSVSGKVVDDDGGPVSSMVVSVCGSTCFYGHTADDGTFTVSVSSHLQIDQFATLLHGRPSFASYYLRLPPLQGDRMIYAAPLVMPKLPASGPAIATDGSAQAITNGDVTLLLVAGTVVTIDFEDVVTGRVGSQLRALRVADPTRMPFIDPAASPGALFALSPFEVAFSQKAALRFTNGQGWPAGSAVDVEAMGGLIGGEPPAGNFTRVAAAHVSADGKTISTDAGEGVLGLTWVSLRRR